ncbi:hypothetical protein [Psychroserpens sp. SPM9]|uniref:hypothetical protein n=1 Tax=Psychroserpens sp. SPM9 TaxID=2975598 RepID=UPI0021A810F8|nr:hypothetical protein [Psychroserpens sp. SPM9]MDG5491400.1 hypothetical protein [Psychroserpens sp. SPM9]
MKVKNRHKRIIQEPIENVSELFKTLATPEDKIWPKDYWPGMYFKDGLKVGNQGGHGIIRYTVEEFEEGRSVKFRFTKPDGFVGTHELSIYPVSKRSTKIIHVLKMKTSFKASIFWLVALRWLHNALIKDAFDNVENYFSMESANKSNLVPKHTYSFWVRFLRDLYKPKKRLHV